MLCRDVGKMELQAAEMQMCWLNVEHKPQADLFDTTGIALDCSAQSAAAGMLTPAQEIYCTSVAGSLQVPFQVSEAETAPGFMRLHGGREQCSMVGHTSDLWKLASADTGLAFLQCLLGSTCLHCSIIAGAFARAESESYPDSQLASVLHQLQCDIQCSA
jgi:hypothetical protein